MRAPEPGKTIATRPAAPAASFLAAYDFITDNYRTNYSSTRPRRLFLKHDTFHGNEIVASTRRLCLMNMFLHNIGEIDGESAISPTDALVRPQPHGYDYVLANPPFGKKSSMSFTNEEGEQETDELTYNRQDFWATTSNKQLNFVQHIRTMLKTTGRAAVVVPDNVLFEGGAGETIRRKLLETTDLHTILRLPTGIFYAHGVKANVSSSTTARPARTLDQRGLVLRLPHQHSPHPEEEAPALRGPGRVRRLLQPGEPPQAQGNLGCRQEPRRPLAQISATRS
jgi:type I restriction enzyme M protein